MLRSAVLSLCAFSALSAPSAFGSTIWNEINAGKLLAGAEITSATDTMTLTDIDGSITNAISGGDLFEIQILNPAAFSATVTGAMANAALYLFDANGHGLFGNDDTSNVNAEPTIPLGTTSALSAGLYYILIVPSGQQPENNANASIFNLAAGSTTIGTPVVSPNVLRNYSDTGIGGNTAKGTYDIVLTGAGFAQSPEPGTLALCGLGLVAAAAFRRRG